MAQLKVIVNTLNRRSGPITDFTEKNIIGTVSKGYIFISESQITNSRGTWYMDRDGYYYWSGGLMVLEENSFVGNSAITNTPSGASAITPVIKKKIEQVVNVFETGSAEGEYAALVKYDDYNDPETNTRIVQVTYGRSQTTEFSHLNQLVEDYVENNGMYASQLKHYVGRIGQKPSLALDNDFCQALKDAGKNDPVMKEAQDRLFEVQYFEPAFNWFSNNGFMLPLSLLVIYDSQIHSGGILGFLRKRFATVVPAKGGSEKEWITNYVNIRNEWLGNHSNPLLRQTTYRTNCFKVQFQNDNWNLSQSINAHGVTIS